MALDPHPDREPGMDARVVTASGQEFAASASDHSWCPLGGDHSLRGYSWQALATAFPDATVVLP